MITTRQELVDAVGRAAAKQGWKRAYDPEIGQCFYRMETPTGPLGCALGALMPDTCPTIQGRVQMGVWTALPMTTANPDTRREQLTILRDAGIDESLRDDAYRMQHAHDSRVDPDDPSAPVTGGGIGWRPAYLNLVGEWGCTVPEGV